MWWSDVPRGDCGRTISLGRLARDGDKGEQHCRDGRFGPRQWREFDGEEGEEGEEEEDDDSHTYSPSPRRGEYQDLDDY